MPRYKYMMDGSNRSDETWKVQGDVRVDADEGDLVTATEHVLSEAFLKLTKGEAIYGQPGVRCDGPYRVKSLLIEVEHES